MAAAYAVALACAGYGVWAIVSTQRPSSLPRTAGWLAGVLVLHDGVLAPALVVAGVLLAHVVPRPARPLVAAGLVVSGLVVLVAAPLVLGLGARAGDPSRLPLPYGRNLVLLLAAVWLAVALIGGLMWVRRSARPTVRGRLRLRTRSRTRQETSR
ncbi:MAG TPA: hypothetical protein VF053_11325 [Streptosporangiales bacterium]